MKLFKKFKSQIEPIKVVTFNPLDKSKAENEMKPKIHAAIVKYWDSFNSELYNELINIKNQ